MKPRKVMVRGQIRWLVESYHGRTRRRAFFKSRAVAEAKAAQLRQDRDAFGRTWLELSTKERMEVCSVVEAARAKGVALADVWRAYEAGQVAGVKGSVTVEAALAAMLRRHYANQAKPVEAKEFFSIEPSALLGEGGEGAAIPARSKLRAQAVEQQPRPSRTEHEPEGNQ